MSFLGEHLAEEWLNRQGYFTIRGAKVGTGEIDLLAIKYAQPNVECWHYEVQASLRPVSYLCPAPKELRKHGKSAHNAKKRDKPEIKLGVSEWIEKKYNNDKIVSLRKSLWHGTWNLGLILGNVKHPEEISLIENCGIRIIRIAEIIQSLSPKWSHRDSTFILGAATGADLVDLVCAHKQLKLEG